MDIVNIKGKSQIVDRYLYLFRIGHANLPDESANVDEQVKVLISLRDDQPETQT